MYSTFSLIWHSMTDTNLIPLSLLSLMNIPLSLLDNSCSVPLDQPAVQKKIQKLHTDLATLEAPQPCTTCQEALPGIPVPQSQECKPRCSNDKYHPKISEGGSNSLCRDDTCFLWFFTPLKHMSKSYIVRRGLTLPSTQGSGHA